MPLGSEGREALSVKKISIKEFRLQDSPTSTHLSPVIGSVLRSVSLSMIVSVGTSIKITLRERERERGRERERERERVGSLYMCQPVCSIETTGMRLTATKLGGGGLSCLITRWGSLQAHQWTYNPEFM